MVNFHECYRLVFTDWHRQTEVASDGGVGVMGYKFSSGLPLVQKSARIVENYELVEGVGAVDIV